MIQDALFGGALSALTKHCQFIIYKHGPHPTKPGKIVKLPCDFRTGRVTIKGNGGAHDPSIWTDAGAAVAAAAQYGTEFGVGFVFTREDNFWFLDIDNAYTEADPTTGAPAGWSALAQGLCAAFPGAAVEVSVSGKGLHIFGTGAVPPHAFDNVPYGLGFYTEARFVALTGTNAIGDAGLDCTHLMPSLVAQFFPPSAAGPTSTADWTDEPVAEWRGPADDDQLIARMLRSQSVSAAFNENKASFADLWNRDIDKLSRAYPDGGDSGSPYGQSEADSALAQHLAFWTGKDCERIQRLMLRSSLVREKWEDRDDYLPRTILAVCARQEKVLTDKEAELVTMPGVENGMASTSSTPTMVTGATFLNIEDQLKLWSGCVYICDEHRVLVPGGALLQEKQFRVMFGGYSFPMDNANERTSRDSWEAFTQHQSYRVPRADSACFKPERAPGELIRDAGRVRVNTWWPVDVPRQVGDATPFWTHLAKLLPIQRDREILLAYMAACVQHKGVKFQWAPLLQGVEGNGKTLLTRCVAEAVGRRYVHWPKASKIAAQFNKWMVGKLFYAVEDIYVADQRRDIIEELKPMITGGDGLEIEGKGIDQTSADICGNFMFNSNHKDAILKTRNDRRFAVFYTAQQQASDLARDGMRGDYMRNLYNWLKNEGGYAIVAELLHTYPIPDELNPAGGATIAPDTSSTEEAISASRGGIEQEVIEAIEQGIPGFAGGWVSSIQLDKLLERLGRSRALSHAKRNDMLHALGYLPHPGLLGGRVNNPVTPDHAKPRLFVKTGSPAAYLIGPVTIAGAYSKAQEIEVKANA